MTSRMLLMVSALFLALSGGVHAASWKDKLKDKLAGEDADDQAAIAKVVDPDVFQPLAPLRWEQDYREAIRAICKSGKAEYLYFDDNYEFAVSRRLKEHPDYVRGSVRGTGQSGHGYDVVRGARLPLATACEDDLFLRNTFPTEGVAFTQLADEEIITGVAVVTFTPLMIAGLPYAAKLTFGQRNTGENTRATELSTGYFKMRQASERPLETAMLGTADWIKRNPAPTQQEIDAVSANFTKPLNQCFQRVESMANTMGGFAAILGNEVDEASVLAMTDTFKSSCVCTYKALGRHAGMPNAAADYVKIEDFLEENWAADSSEWISDIKRQQLIGRLASGHQNLSLYSTAMMTCNTEITGSGSDVPTIRRTRLPGDTKQADDHIPKPVPRNTPLHLSLPLMQVELVLHEEPGLTGTELQAAQNGILEAFDSKFTDLQRYDWSQDLSNSRWGKRKQKMRDTLTSGTCVYNRYLGVDASGSLLRHGNERETFCLHSEPTNPNYDIKLHYSTMVFGASGELVTYQAPPDVFKAYLEAFDSYFDAVRRRASDEGLEDL